MMGLAHLVETCLGKPTRLTRDGLISRAENRAMVELLDVDLDAIEEVTWRPGEALVMVDSQPNTGRHNFDGDVPLYAVIDHHDTRGDLDGIPVRGRPPDLGATCSLVDQLPDGAGHRAAAARGDRPAVRHRDGAERLSARGQRPGRRGPAVPVSAGRQGPARPHPQRPAAAKLLRVPAASAAVSFIYDRLIISWVNELPQPELAAEVVDFLIRFEEVDWAVCAGVFQDKLILSVRASVENAHAGDMLAQVVGKLRPGRRPRPPRRRHHPSAEHLAQRRRGHAGQLRRRLLKALHIDECRGQRLVPRREMLHNLQA